MLLNVALYLGVGVLAWLAGGLVNYLADVLPHQRRLVRPFCLACRAPFPWRRYLLWPRRCQVCGRRRGVRTLLVELALIILGIWLISNAPAELGLGLSLLLCTYFALVIVIDFEHHLVMHLTSLAGALLGIWIGVSLHGWRSTVIGGLFGLGAMFVLYVFGIYFVRLLRRLQHQPVPEDEGLGFGDVFLSGVIGLMLGWQGIVVGLLLAILLAGAVSLVNLLWMFLRRKYTPGSVIPYGPFLVLAAALLIFAGDRLLQMLY